MLVQHYKAELGQPSNRQQTGSCLRENTEPVISAFQATFRLLPFWFFKKYLTKLGYNLLAHPVQANGHWKMDDTNNGIPLQMHWNYKGTCEPHNNKYLCDYDYGDCCQPGTVCRNKLMYYTVLNLQNEGFDPHFCTCGVNPGPKITGRDGNLGPPIYTEG